MVMRGRSARSPRRRSSSACGTHAAGRALHAAAQFNSVWKELDEPQRQALEAEAKAKKVKLSRKGFADAPATFRKTKIPDYVKDAPNPDARVLGGVLVNGQIERKVIVNLLALRGLRGADVDETVAVRRYLLGLALLAATADIDLFLREGCLLRYAAEDEDMWHAIPRRGKPEPLALLDARETVEQYARNAAEHFKSRWPKDEELKSRFDLKAAKKLLSKPTAEEEGTPAS